MGRRRNSPATQVFGWMRSQSMKVKSFFGLIIALACLAGLRFAVKDHNHFFIASEAIHAAGILVLIYKLTTQRTCSGLSLKSQQLTALFLAVRLVCSGIMEANIHTLLDLATLISTLWVTYMIQFKLKSTYIKELDNMPLYYLVVPSVILAVLIHPYMYHMRIARICWALCVYLESVSVLPQLRLMQNAKMIEPFTSHYVFALGVARFLACAHWIIRVYDTRGAYVYSIGSGYLWFPTVLLAEIVQTFILADFCYYYIKSFMEGQLVMKMPV
ncbi:ER lumen protein-retaining receptor erd-2.2 [Jatropha curcas]|uniref:ER lumen protein-retaining receptor erd-2.2 n=1 Tax=Jatropha curcas TaxID=180498 RepID=UPI0005FBB913|nr:ER lumen protein-retaining receptor erd-2.2 [Jatropha curcas]